MKDKFDLSKHVGEVVILYQGESFTRGTLVGVNDYTYILSNAETDDGSVGDEVSVLIELVNKVRTFNAIRQ